MSARSERCELRTPPLTDRRFLAKPVATLLEHVAFGWNQTRHCERSEAIQRTSGPYVPLDCFVANAPRNDDSKSEQPSLARRFVAQ